jgi:transposase
VGCRSVTSKRLEVMLEDASIKLSSVSSTMGTVSARAILRAMIGGESDPLVLAQLAKGKLRQKIPDLEQALTGFFDRDHALLAASMLDRLEQVNADLAELDTVIADACAPWQHQIDLLMTIPGVGEKTAQVIIAETGADMSRFPSANHLSAWAGVAPAIYESAGKRRPSGTRHGNKWLTTMLYESAGSVARTKDTYLSSQHARIMSRRGGARANMAVAHSILVSAYFMLKRDEPYRDLGPQWLQQRNDDAHTRRLVAQLERLGHTVVLDPAA